jgi:hypothetical protein
VGQVILVSKIGMGSAPQLKVDFGAVLQALFNGSF